MSPPGGVRERELKAVVDDPAALVDHLGTLGARLSFRGRMSDRRYDRPDGALTARDEVLRVRTFDPAAGGASRAAELAWKGPTRRAQGYKEREEHQLEVSGTEPLETMLSRLGFVVCDAIDRCVETYDLAGAVVRLEWYPRMDTLVEVEGEPAAIEQAVRATGLPRAGFTADRLLEFAERYRERTGAAPALALAALEGVPPAWPEWGTPLATLRTR